MNVREGCALLLLIGMLVFALRPVRHAVWAQLVPLLAAGAAAALLPAHSAVDSALALLPVLCFLATVLVLAWLCEVEGLFQAAGAFLARTCSGEDGRASAAGGRRLLVMVFAIASATTVVLSLDATVVLLTPVVLVTATRLKARPEPSLYACAHLANTASLLLPVSNLTNLLVVAALGLSFGMFTAMMALPCLLAVAVELLVFRWFFSDELRFAAGPAGSVANGPHSGEPGHSEPAAPKEAPRFVLAVLALTLLGFALTGLLGLSPAWASLLGAAVLGVRALRRGEATAASVLRAAQPQFLVFVLALSVVVRAVVDNGLGEAVAGVLPTGTGLGALLLLAAAGAVLSNLVNNLPALLILLPVVQHAGLAPAIAVLIGVNLGPNLTYVGSLATLLWRRVLLERGVAPQLGVYTKLGLATTPITIFVAVMALWLETLLVRF